jgi:hypothetical protein
MASGDVVFEADNCVVVENAVEQKLYVNNPSTANASINYEERRSTLKNTVGTTPASAPYPSITLQLDKFLANMTETPINFTNAVASAPLLDSGKKYNVTVTEV